MKIDLPSECPRFSGSVQRYSSWPTIQTQTVADHTWQVMRIYREIFGPPDRVMFDHLLYHDGGEGAVGDLPFPLKSQNPELANIHGELEDDALARIHGYTQMMTNHEKVKLKICDLLEMWEFGRAEMAMGNTMGRPIVERTLAAVRKMNIVLKANYQEEAEKVNAYIHNSLGGKYD